MTGMSALDPGVARNQFPGTDERAFFENAARLHALNRHSRPKVCFSTDYVSFTPGSRPTGGLATSSASYPTPDDRGAGRLPL